MSHNLTPEENRSMTTGAILFGIGGLLGTLAFGGDIWAALFVAFLLAVAGVFFGAWMASK